MWALVAGIAVAVLAGCSSSSLDASAAQHGKAPTSTSTAATELDTLLAPIALYPDSLIAQMLLASTEPAKVTQLHTWLSANKALKGTDLQDAATVEGFDPSLVALSLFPQVVGLMAERLDWTTRLGKAFTANRSGVFDSIQRLRVQAQKAGALKDTPQQEVESKVTPAGETVIVIEPANPQVIYVPQYDPQVVYAAPTTVVVEDDDDDVDAAVAGLIGFTAGIAIGAAVDNDYYYGPYGWGGGVYLHNDAWDDWYDAREDAREDWTDHREELVEERGERAREAGEQRTDRVESRQEGRGDTQAQRTERQQNRQETRPQSADAARQRAATSPRAVGTSGSTQTTGDAARVQRERSGTTSDAFSGYSSGRSERAASARGQRSRSGGGGGGGGRRR